MNIFNQLKHLYYKILSWYIFNAWIYIESLNLFKIYKTYNKVSKYFSKPKIKFQYGKLNNVITGNLYNDYHNENHCILSLVIKDVGYKWKYDDIRFESEPIISLTLFNKWRFVWELNAPIEDDYMYWEMLLEYLYIYNENIEETKLNFGWKKHKKDNNGNNIVDENGNYIWESAWNDDILNEYGKIITHKIQL
jgi:hypothetical protein